MHDELFAEIFGQRIGIARVGGGGLRRRIDVRYAVAGRGCDVDDALDAVRARAFEHRECAVDVGAKIGFRLLDRWHDVRARGQMKNTLNAGTGGHHRRLVRDIALDDFKRGIAGVLVEIRPPADHEIVEDAHTSTLGQKPIDQVAANESGSPGDQVQHSRPPIPSLKKAVIPC